jgi:uncharacterized tellurite resistance protein B-like protein
MNTNTAKIIKTEDGKLFVHTPEYNTVKERLESKWFQDDKLIRFTSRIEFTEDFINDLAIISSAAILSDSVHQEEETIVAMEICKEMNIDWNKFNDLLNSEICRVAEDKYPTAYDYLQNSNFGTNTKNKMLLFEASLHIILADGIMTEKESELIENIANILNIPLSQIILRISQLIRFEKELLVDIL